MVLEVKNAHFGYEQKSVLRGVDLRVMQGEVISLLGINGSGKSTLLRLMLDLLSPSKGEIFLEGKNIREFKRSAIASRLAYIPQSNNTPFGYTALEMVMMARFSLLSPFAQLSKKDELIAQNALKRVGIEDLSDRIYITLSGGQKQLVLLARAIAQGSQTILMDEPVSGLDYGNQLKLLRLISSLAKDGYTIIQTTHYPDHAFLLDSRVVILDNGVIVSDGASSEVITAKSIEELYGIEAEIISHGGYARCLPKIY